jgi:hypothetical protein
MKVIRIRIGLLPQGPFYYLVNDTILEISEYEFGKVVISPYRYYFSTALRLHNRIERAKQAIESWSLERT